PPPVVGFVPPEHPTSTTTAQRPKPKRIHAPPRCPRSFTTPGPRAPPGPMWETRWGAVWRFVLEGSRSVRMGGRDPLGPNLTQSFWNEEDPAGLHRETPRMADFRSGAGSRVASRLLERKVITKAQYDKAKSE